MSAAKATYFTGPLEHELSFGNQPVKSCYTVTFSLKLAHVRGLWGRWRQTIDGRWFEYKNYCSNTDSSFQLQNFALWRLRNVAEKLFFVRICTSYLETKQVWLFALRKLGNKASKKDLLE